MTEINALNALRDEILKYKFEVKFSCWVDITHINNPHSFFVRPRSYNDYLPVLLTRGLRIPACEINEGDVVLFKSKIINKYLRGRIISIEGEVKPKYNVLAIDDGCFEQSVSLKRIWSLQYQTSLPGLATHCRLADCAPFGNTWDEPAIDAMKFYVRGERAKIIVRNKTADSVTVEVYNSNPDDLATMLALSGYTTMGYVGNNDKD